MKQTVATVSCILAALLLCLACNRETEKNANTSPPKAGRPADSGEPINDKLVPTDELPPTETSSPDIGTVTAQEGSDGAKTAEEPLPSPPYITLGRQTRPGEITLCEGQPVPLYYELADDTPKTCWVALVLEQTQSKLACDNEKLAIQKQPIAGDKMGQLLFIMPPPGEYRLRLFTSADDSAEFVSEAQPFRVVSREEWTELGQQGKAAGSGS